MTKVWVLTRSYNDYNQHGDYFLAVFKDKPTEAQLKEYGVAEGDLQHVLSGGGRRGNVDEWENLFTENL